MMMMMMMISEIQLAILLSFGPAVHLTRQYNYFMRPSQLEDPITNWTLFACPPRMEGQSKFSVLAPNGKYNLQHRFNVNSLSFKVI